jgi:hypothetical protein
MSNVNFVVGNNRNCRFTSTQIEKVNRAIEIFQKVWASSQFKKAVSSHNWTNETGNTFNRFHMSNGMSNEQVWACIKEACNTPNGAPSPNNTITVMPCANWNDYNWCVNSGIPCVCVNVNYINYDWYTPVHIASSIMYDFCVNCCGFGTATAANNSSWWINTVPAACSRIVRDCAVVVCKDVVGKWKINTTNSWNCFPCAVSWPTNTVANWMNSGVKVSEAICAIQYEIDCLNNVNKKSSEEMGRYTMLVNAVETMNAISNKMCVTSLDGCETAWMSTANVKNVVTG